MNHVILFVLMYLIVPLWGMAGLADWLCHRRADIARNAGPKESLIHLLMLAEVSLPVLAGLFLEINGLVIAAMIGFLCLHRATMVWDVRYAVKHREVTFIERRVHNCLEILPLLGLLSIMALHWPQFIALFGLGAEPVRVDLSWKRDKLPTAYIGIVMVNWVLLEFLPYVQELHSGLKPGNSRRRAENETGTRNGMGGR